MKNWLSSFKNVTNGILDNLFENLFESYEEEQVEAFDEREEEEDSEDSFIRFQHCLANLILDFPGNFIDALYKTYLSSDEEEFESFNEEYEEEYEEAYEEEDDEEEVPLRWQDYVIIAIGTIAYIFGFFYFATL